MELESVRYNYTYDCIFRGLQLGNCSNEKTLLYICDNHLSRIFNIDIVKHEIITTESRLEETIKFASLNSRSRNRIFPILHTILNNNICLRENFGVILNEYVGTLNIPRSQYHQIINLLTVLYTGNLIYTQGMICNNISVAFQFLNDDRHKRFLDQYWNNTVITAIISPTETRTIEVNSLPWIYKLLLYPMLPSDIANNTERRSSTPNIIFNMYEGFVTVIRDLLLSNENTTYSSPLIIMAQKNIDGDFSLQQILKTSSVTLFNMDPYAFGPCNGGGVGGGGVGAGGGGIV